MPKIDIAALPERSGSRYPSPYDQPCQPRRWKVLGDVAGLTQFGVNLVTLPPGSWSSQRHWHSHEDELAYVLEGEVVMVTDAGEETLRPGDCAGFKAGVKDGHHFQNRTSAPVVMLVVGTRDERDYGEYSDIDMRFGPGRYASPTPTFTRKDGSAFD
jgi:uncharacterized cupin superfamily protein